VLFAVCGSEPGAGQQGKTVERSADGGRTWTVEHPTTALLAGG
jgi:hypothetical protein